MFGHLSSAPRKALAEIYPPAARVRCMHTAAHAACPGAWAEAHRTAGAASTVETTATEQVRARLSFDFDQQSSNTVDASVLRGTCAPVARRESSWQQDARATEQQALDTLEAEWAQKLQAPLDELADFEETVSRAATELHTFLSRC